MPEESTMDTNYFTKDNIKPNHTCHGNSGDLCKGPCSVCDAIWDVLFD